MTIDDRAASSRQMETYLVGSVRVRPLAPVLGAEVLDLDLSRPLDAATLGSLQNALEQFSVLLFRRQNLHPERQIAFSRGFGVLQEVAQKQYQMAGQPEIFVIGNAREGGRRIADCSVGRLWHSDQSFISHPAMGSALYGVTCPPEGADTLFASCYAAFDTLPAATQRELRTLDGMHSFPWYYEGLRWRDRSQPALTAARRAAYPEVRHPLVRRHPRTGRELLYVNAAYMRTIVGLPDEAARALLRELLAHQVEEAFIYRHKWQTGDLLMWENIGVIHKATAFDSQRYTRRMHRTTIGSSAAAYQQSLPIPSQLAS